LSHCSPMKRIWLPTLLLTGTIATEVVGATCRPSCAPDRGVCFEGRCLCRSLFGGAGCQDTVLGDQLPSQSAADAETRQPPDLLSEPPESEAEADAADDTSDAVTLHSIKRKDAFLSAIPLIQEDVQSHGLGQERLAASVSVLRAAGSRPRHRMHSILSLKKAPGRAEELNEQAENQKELGALGVSDQAKTTDPRACIPWLAELRSVALQNVSAQISQDVPKNMEAARRESFRLWAGSEEQLEKAAFLDKLHIWFRGPGDKEAIELFDRLDQSPEDGALTFDEYNWENLCGYRQMLLTVLASREEKFSQEFRFIDTSQDGKLEEKEFLDRSTGEVMGLSKAAAQAIFKELDADGSGVVSRTEFQQVGGLPRLRREVFQREPEEKVAFKEADLDHDGFLSHSEFDQHVVDMGAFTKPSSAAAALLALDRNGDGKVAEAEYVNMCQAHTGGACEVDSVCPSWRGPAVCETGASIVAHTAGKGSCVCAEGFCAKNGACIPEELSRSGDSHLGPGSRQVADKLSHAEDRILLKKLDGIALAKVALGILSLTAVMSQMKLTFENYPGLMAFVFIFSVIAFVSVIYTAFRAYVPGTITTNLQALCAVLLCASCTLTLTSAVRLVRPSCAKSIPILWFCYDDGKDFGISISEEFWIRQYQRFSIGFSLLCILGVYFTPVPGLEENDTFRMLICALYVFIVLMDAWMLAHEAETASFRNLIWNLEIEVRSGDDKAKVHLDSVAAHWNLKSADYDQMSKEFGVRRRDPSARHADVSGVAGVSPMASRSSSRSSSRPSQAGTLLHLLPDNPDGRHVRGHVVLIWEDTDVHLVQRSPSGKWISACSTEAAQRGPAMTSEGQVICPAVQAQVGTEDSQTIQQKMHVLTQAGAAGLIVGLRKFNAPTSSVFEVMKEPVQEIWPGTYLLDGTDRQFGPENYETNWFLKKSVMLGSAINTFVIANQDFQELVFALEACKLTLPGDKINPIEQSLVALRASLPSSRLTNVQTFKAAKIANLNKLDIIKPEDPMADKMAHLRMGQRIILEKMTKGSVTPEFQWLDNIRQWILATPVVKWEFYPGIHLLLTFVVLLICLWMLEQCSGQLYDNDFPIIATVAFALISLIQGVNASYDMYWWPMSETARNPAYREQWGACHGLGMVATGSAIVLYSGLATALCLWHFFRDVTGR